MSLLIVSLLIAGAALVGVKVYFQEKEKQTVENQKAEDTVEQNLPNPSKTNEDIVAERLAEIAKFETEVSDKTVQADLDNKAFEIKKPKAKQKKYYRPKKQQPKIKAKQ